jgi:hypothetical protein
MNGAASVFDLLASRIALRSAELGSLVDIQTMQVIDRHGQIALAPPSDRSPNGACCFVRAKDDWLAVSLARDSDFDLVPAWLCCEPSGDPWKTIGEQAVLHDCANLVERAILLGLPVARVAETVWTSFEMPRLALGQACKPVTQLTVVDLSSLWAGPLCGAVLAALGASVIKIESVSRPDPTHRTIPEFDLRLNGKKRLLSLDFADADDLAQLFELIAASNVVISSARPRAFENLGLSPGAVFARNPGLIWVAITGYGWGEPGRVAFGDDAAAAGGLVRWTRVGAPHFLGDALSDPLSGLVASAETLRSLATGGGELIDVAMARCSAATALHCGIARAA